MNICIIGMVDEYLRIGFEHILKYSIGQVLHNENIKIYRVCKLGCDVVFIDIDNLSMSVAIATLKSIKPGVMIFIIATRESTFNRVNLALNYKGIFLYKSEQVNTLKNIIKSKFSSILLSMEQYDESNMNVSPKELTPCQKIIINLIHSGLTAKDISAILHKSEKTISGHKRSAMKRLGVTTNYELHELRLFECVSGSFKINRVI
ncbi:response regulator transcription factor [Yersinia kristensenii]|uniref:response regulator transcription factor n=1 Tax=Yersinia kristensenii TaxID=28152 RepID=UPI001C610160|nr:LuxR C-terminal-related transcriptional regulator [Yersinia kristensenii]MBW5812506.1 response regulator transcription factor [Yersinia kristensenii]MBW5829807.1 response regulator transcription factor [Yersinia kristensenii]